LRAWIWFVHGGHASSPISGEDIFVQYLGVDGQWRTILQRNSSFTGPETLSVTVTDPRALHAGFRLRFDMPNGSAARTRAATSTGGTSTTSWFARGRGSRSCCR
jgi:hypothetical protein